MIRFTYIVTAFLTMTFAFLNCSQPLSGNSVASSSSSPTPTPAILPDSSTATTTSTATATPSSSALTASFSPATIHPGTLVAINASGGTSPYIYTTLVGTGTLSSNAYLPSAAETAEILVTDAKGLTATVSFAVTALTCTATQPATTQTTPCSSGFTGTETSTRTVTCNTSTGSWVAGAWSAYSTSACVAVSCTLDGAAVPVGTTTQCCIQTSSQCPHGNCSATYSTNTNTCQASGLWSVTNTTTATSNYSCPGPSSGGDGGDGGS